MKKIITSALLLVASLTSYSQSKNDVNYPWVSIGTVASYEPTSRSSDAANTTFGVQAKIGAIYKNVEVAIKYKYMTEIELQQLGVQVNLVAYPFYRFDLVSGAEFGGINRTGNSNHFYVAFNSELRYNLTDKLNIGLQGNISTRSDIQYFYSKNSTQFTPEATVNLYLKLN